MGTYGLRLNHYGTVEVSYIQQELEKFWTENEWSFEYADDYRLCRVGDKSEESLFDEIARQGCCGTHEMTLGPSPEGHTYRYGFNYGH